MMHSRREFLESLAGTPLAASLSRGIAPLLGEPVLKGGKMVFPKPDVIRYDSHCFTLNGVDTLIHSGSFHYSRCPRELWRDRLLKLKAAGLNAIETYIIWNYHEPLEGHCDLSELESFIGEVARAGLWLIARPGPYACAEWDAGGFPHWILAERFPLRSDDPRSVETSRHWFGEVLPVIRRHQITQGGPIILMQIENEYNFWPGPSDANRRAYISALAHMAWDAGIEVPLFTCWTRQSRENSYPTMARIMDTCNFYPRWDIFPDVPDQLAKLRRQEPDSPMAIAELQGGWFSQFGGKLSVDQDGIDGAQLNLLTKTVLEQGVTSFNYYMGFGGTNFDWAAHGITTTYDYAAPVREPGGLWEKYFAARGVALALELFGSVLTRAEAIPGCASDNHAVAASERVNGKSGVVFIREAANANQQFKLTFMDAASPTHRKIAVPREGLLEIGPRGMKMFPVQIPIAGGTLRYSTSDVLASGTIGDQHYLVVYDDPGALVEIAFATENEPHVRGDFKYLYWDRDYESVVIGAVVAPSEKIIIVNGRLKLIVAPRDRALRSWFPMAMSVVGGIPGQIPLIGDASLLVESGSDENGRWADLQFEPGQHELTAILSAHPSDCRIDGQPAAFQFDPETRSASLAIKTPPLPVAPLDLTEVAYWVEKFDLEKGDWLTGELRPLDGIGIMPYGYVKYRAEFSYQGESKLFLSAFTEDGKKVFLDGRLLEDASNDQREAQANLHGKVSPGRHLLEIAYEAFGSFNFGKKLSELKGLEVLKIGSDAAGARTLGDWSCQLHALPMRGREVDPDFSIGKWQKAALSGSASSASLTPSFVWCRAEFSLDEPPAEWFAPLYLKFEAGRDALIYLNGKFVGRYVTVGPQSEFYLPEPFLVFGGGKNVLTAALAYAAHPGWIKTLRVAPYQEFATRRTRVEFIWEASPEKRR